MQKNFHWWRSPCVQTLAWTHGPQKWSKSRTNRNANARHARGGTTALGLNGTLIQNGRQRRRTAALLKQNIKEQRNCRVPSVHTSWLRQLSSPNPARAASRVSSCRPQCFLVANASLSTRLGNEMGQRKKEEKGWGKKWETRLKWRGDRVLLSIFACVHVCIVLFLYIFAPQCCDNTLMKRKTEQFYISGEVKQENIIKNRELKIKN